VALHADVGIWSAIPLMIIRPFLPESPVWRQRKRPGTLKRPSFGELFAPRFRRTTIVTTVMMAAVYGAAFGAISRCRASSRASKRSVRCRAPQQEQTISVRAVFQEFGGWPAHRARALAAVIDRTAPPARALSDSRMFLLPTSFLTPVEGSAGRAGAFCSSASSPSAK
jgi:hypothetical protein